MFLYLKKDYVQTFNQSYPLLTIDFDHINNNYIVMQAETEHSIVKSIIYGNLVQNNQGIMRALCSAIGSKDHIDKIILFLKNSHNFQKYNRLIYAFRLEHQPNHLFLTQDTPQHKFLQGYNDDTGLEGNGQKLLALLQKFNVRNVLVIVALRQKDSLREFNSEHYMQIVKCAKDLLSSLYDKVVLNRSEEQLSYESEQVEKVALTPKEYVIPLEEHQKVERPVENPNYVGLEHVRKVSEPSLRSEKAPTIAYLDSKIKQLAGVLEDIIQRFGEAEDKQARFAIKYDKNKRVSKVFTLLAKLFEFNKKQDLLDQNISTHLRSITNRNLSPGTIRALNQELMSDRTLRSDIVVRENKVCGLLMEFLEILLKSYSFAKKLAMIESEIEEKEEVDEENSEEPQQWSLIE